MTVCFMQYSLCIHFVDIIFSFEKSHLGFCFWEDEKNKTTTTKTATTKWNLETFHLPGFTSKSRVNDIKIGYAHRHKQTDKTIANERTKLGCCESFDVNYLLIKQLHDMKCHT